MATNLSLHSNLTATNSCSTEVLPSSDVQQLTTFCSKCVTAGNPRTLWYV